MSLPSQHPPLLLTKRLTSFLHANQTSQLPTLLVATQTGKLLAHASPNPVSLLRTHATVAASLFAIHTSSAPALSAALPGGAHTPEGIPSSPLRGDDYDDDGDADTYDEQEEEEEEEDSRGRPRPPPVAPDLLKPATITVQLSGGTVLIRRLKCGLLFVCVGPPSADHGDHHNHHLHPVQHLDSGELVTAAAALAVSTSPSEVASQISVGGQSTSSHDSVGAAMVVAMRRQASDLARWLDDKLGTLAVPEEGVGAD